MSLSTIIVAANAQLLRRLKLPGRGSIKKEKSVWDVGHLILRPVPEDEVLLALSAPLRSNYLITTPVTYSVSIPLRTPAKTVTGI